MSENEKARAVIWQVYTLHLSMAEAGALWRLMSWWSKTGLPVSKEQALRVAGAIVGNLEECDVIDGLLEEFFECTPAGYKPGLTTLQAWRGE